jgi:hypothetical protein
MTTISRCKEIIQGSKSRDETNQRMFEDYSVLS